jgi:DNA polymerase (family 10)
LTVALREVAGVDQVTLAGSFRRKRETVGDLDIVVTAASGDAVMDRFVTDKEVKEVISHGPTRSSVLLKIGLQVDLRVVPNESYGAALVYFTGSKAHNIAIRRIAQTKGLKLNEYGVFRRQAHRRRDRRIDLQRARATLDPAGAARGQRGNPSCACG